MQQQPSGRRGEAPHRKATAARHVFHHGKGIPEQLESPQVKGLSHQQAAKQEKQMAGGVNGSRVCRIDELRALQPVE